MGRSMSSPTHPVGGRFSGGGDATLGILGRARKMVGGLAGTPPRIPQLYQVACVAGHRLRGERTEGYQALRCPTFGEGIFVLPRSPLPEPPAPASPSRPRIEIAEPDLLHD